MSGTTFTKEWMVKILFAHPVYKSTLDLQGNGDGPDCNAGKVAFRK